jgi:hypothetical protein
LQAGILLSVAAQLTGHDDPLAPAAGWVNKPPH